MVDFKGDISRCEMDQNDIFSNILKMKIENALESKLLLIEEKSIDSECISCLYKNYCQSC